MNRIDGAKDNLINACMYFIHACEEQGVREWSTIKTRVRESLIKYIYSKACNKNIYNIHILYIHKIFHSSGSLIN